MLIQALGAARDLGRLQEIAGVLVRHGFGDTVRRLGIADSTTTDPRQVVEGADLVILCTPLGDYASIARAMAPARNR